MAAPACNTSRHTCMQATYASKHKKRQTTNHLPSLLLPPSCSILPSACMHGPGSRLGRGSSAAVISPRPAMQSAASGCFWLKEGRGRKGGLASLSPDPVAVNPAVPRLPEQSPTNLQGACTSSEEELGRLPQFCSRGLWGLVCRLLSLSPIIVLLPLPLRHPHTHMHTHPGTHTYLPYHA
jgi:hypothetical protein